MSEFNSTRIAKLLPISAVGIALFVLIFSNLSGIGSIFQYVAIALLVTVATAYCLLKGIPSKQNYLTLALVLSSIVSLIVCVIYKNEYAGYYTIIFLVETLALWIIGYYLDPSQLLTGARWAFGGMVVICLLFQSDNYFAMLSPGSGEKWNLRYAPFEMHPNLTGLTFGAAFCLFAAGAFYGKALQRSFNILFAILALSIVLAASARASILGIGMAGAIMVLFGIRDIIRRHAALTLTLVIGIVILGIIFNGSLYAYLAKILEFDSETRGINSGGTGRVELWARGIDLAFSNGEHLLLGTGLRSSTPEQIGFSTENSYITILIDSGIILGGAVILAFFARTLEVSALAFKEKKEYLYTLAFLSIFVLFESFFNRYLVGIGNPTSVLLPLLLVSYSVHNPVRRQRRVKLRNN